MAQRGKLLLAGALTALLLACQSASAASPRPASQPAADVRTVGRALEAGARGTAGSSGREGGGAGRRPSTVRWPGPADRPPAVAVRLQAAALPHPRWRWQRSPVRRREDRHDSDHQGRPGTRHAIPRHLVESPVVRQRTGPARARLSSRATPRTAASSSATPTPPGGTRSSAIRCQPTPIAAIRQQASSCWPSTTPPRTITEAWSCSGLTATSGSAPATAAQPATVTRTARTGRRCSGRCCDSTSTAASRTRSQPTTRTSATRSTPRRSGRWACGTRGAIASTAPTGTSGSRTSARTHSRRSIGCRAAAPAG